MAKEFSKMFYKSPEWKRVRKFCMMRDMYLCQKCGRPAEEVHHKVHLTPENIMNAKVSLNPDNLVCLCKTCHFEEHKLDQVRGRTLRYDSDILPEITFDQDGKPVIIPPQGRMTATAPGDRWGSHLLLCAECSQDPPSRARIIEVIYHGKAEKEE